MYARAALDAKGVVAKVFDALGKDVRIDNVQFA
jgi:1-deoxy-D-xylulose-5-phosphate synthase